MIRRLGENFGRALVSVRDFLVKDALDCGLLHLLHKGLDRVKLAIGVRMPQPTDVLSSVDPTLYAATRERGHSVSWSFFVTPVLADLSLAVREEDRSVGAHRPQLPLRAADVREAEVGVALLSLAPLALALAGSDVALRAVLHVCRLRKEHGICARLAILGPRRRWSLLGSGLHDEVLLSKARLLLHSGRHWPRLPPHRLRLDQCSVVRILLGVILVRWLERISHRGCILLLLGALLVRVMVPLCVEMTAREAHALGPVVILRRWPLLEPGVELEILDQLALEELAFSLQDGG